MSLLLLLRNREAAFSPLDYAPALWLDGADAGSVYQDSALTTLTVADGDPVGGWKDRSGNARHALQATAPKRTILKLALQNGRNGVRCDGLDDLLQAAFGVAVPQPYTLYVVAKFRSAFVAQQAILDAATSTTGYLFRSTDNTKTYFTNGNQIGPAAGATDAWNIYTVVANGASSSLQINVGTPATGNLGAVALDGLTLGARGGETEHGDLDFIEAILYPAVHTAPLQAQFLAYLNQKWAVY